VAWHDLRAAGTSPPDRHGYGYAHDTLRRRAVLFGGYDTHNPSGLFH
jgi:hypothetical protein